MRGDRGDAASRGLMAGLRIHVVMDKELVARIDAALSGESRGEFVRRAVEQALSEAKEPLSGMRADPGSVPSSEGVRSAAPAEQSESPRRPGPTTGPPLGDGDVLPAARGESFEAVQGRQRERIEAALSGEAPVEQPLSRAEAFRRAEAARKAALKR